MYSSVTHQVFEQVQALQDDLLVSHLLHLQLVQVVDGEVQETLAHHVVVHEEVGVRVDAVVQTCKKQSKLRQKLSLKFFQQMIQRETSTRMSSLKTRVLLQINITL